MKNLSLLFLTVFILFSCSSDNDTQDPPMPMETCATPVITLTDISSNEVSFTITASNAIQVEYGVEGFTLGTGTTVDVSGNTFTLTGLLPSTAYDLYAKAICSTTESDYFGPLNLMTQCDNGTFQGNVILTTQQEVNDFGAMCYSSINGSFTIGVFDVDSDISNLNSLSSLVSVQVSLRILSNPLLTSLTGFENLTSISNLFLYSNINLIDLDAFQSLNLINNIIIGSCDSLQSINGLQNLTVDTVGTLTFNDNNSLVNLNGLESITSIGNLVLQNNQALSSLSGINNITTIQENTLAASNAFGILISECGSLLNLNGLNSLTSIEDDIIIQRCQSLTSLNGIEMLNSCDAIIIGGTQSPFNSSLTDFCALQNIVNNGSYNTYTAINNAYNPTIQDIQNGNCSQ